MHHLKRKVNKMDMNMILLNEHLAKEEREVNRADAIEARADELLKEGAECYPLSPSNFREALSEMADTQVETIAKYVRIAKSTEFHDTMQNEMIARMLWVYASGYMRKYAKSKAEKDIDNEI